MTHQHHGRMAANPGRGLHTMERLDTRKKTPVTLLAAGIALALQAVAMLRSGLDIDEDLLAVAEGGSYAANVEAAETRPSGRARPAAKAALEKRRMNREKKLEALHIPLSVATTRPLLQVEGSIGLVQELELERKHDWKKSEVFH